MASVARSPWVAREFDNLQCSVFLGQSSQRLASTADLADFPCLAATLDSPWHKRQGPHSTLRELRGAQPTLLRDIRKRNRMTK